MTAKQRVSMAFEHRDTDRVPLDYLGTPEFTRALMDRLAIDPGQCASVPDYRRLLFDFVVSESPSYDELLRRLCVDFRLVRPDYVGPRGKDYGDPDLMEDIYGTAHRKVTYPTHVTYEPFLSPLADATSVDEVDAHPWFQADWFDYSGIAQRCAAQSDFALVAGKSDLMGAGEFLQGMENFLIGLVTDDPVTIAILDRLTESFFEFNQRVFESADGKLDIAWYGDDYGTQNGLLIGAPTWRKHIRPRLARLIDLARSHGLKVMLHSCGSVRELVPDLIDVGIDILDTLQPEAAGMDPRQLKDTFGDRICFHGMISTAGVLANGTPEDVRNEVIDRIETMAPGGGFCLSPTHTIMPGTPVENVLALYETATGCQIRDRAES